MRRQDRNGACRPNAGAPTWAATSHAAGALAPPYLIAVGAVGAPATGLGRARQGSCRRWGGGTSPMARARAGGPWCRQASEGLFSHDPSMAGHASDARKLAACCRRPPLAPVLPPAPTERAAGRLPRGLHLGRHPGLAARAAVGARAPLARPAPAGAAHRAALRRHARAAAVALRGARGRGAGQRRARGHEARVAGLPGLCLGRRRGAPQEPDRQKRHPGERAMRDTPTCGAHVHRQCANRLPTVLSPCRAAWASRAWACHSWMRCPRCT